jgi:hypothetical protein
MPIRTASLANKVSTNGQVLHRLRMRRIASGGDEPSAAETAALEERRLLKEERDKRDAQPRHRPTALDRLVRTHHAQPKDKPKAKNAHADETRKPKTLRTRAEKHAEKAAALEAARRSPKKPAK